MSRHDMQRIMKFGAVRRWGNFPFRSKGAERERS